MNFFITSGPDFIWALIEFFAIAKWQSLSKTTNLSAMVLAAEVTMT